MSDWFYNLVRCAGCPVFWLSSTPTIINAEVTRRDGAYILAANHLSPYDVPLLIRHSARHIDFVSMVESFRNPLVANLYGSMNAFPLDRSRPDGRAVRKLLERLERGRVVGIFPEGHIRSESNSVICGGPIRPGIGRISALADVPVIPCVVLHSRAYARCKSWLPLMRTRYALNYGEPIAIDRSLTADMAAADLEDRLCAQFRVLHQQLLQM